MNISRVFAKKIAILILTGLVGSIFASETNAQRPRFPDFFGNQSSQSGIIQAAQQGTIFPGFGSVPQGSVIGPIAPPPATLVVPNLVTPGFAAPALGTPSFGGGTFAAPSFGPATITPPSFNTTPNFNPTPVFDPFRSTSQALPFNTRPRTGGAANNSPSLLFPPQNVEVLPPVQSQVQPFGFQQPGLAQPGIGRGSIGFQQPTFQGPGFQGPGFQVPTFQQPNFQPGFGVGGAGIGSGFGAGFGTGQGLFGGRSLFPRSGQSGQFFRRFRDEYLPRLLERPRIRHTYLPGGNGNELQINDTEIATTLTFPRFLFLQQPIRITPGFIAHFWDGPETQGPFGTGFDLPETAFSAFLTTEYLTDLNQRSGFETNFTVGIYSDYRHLTSDSLRLTGNALGWTRLSETNVFKFGVEYFDRLDLKLLPAFGLFIRPTPDLELDLYFPRPRIAQRVPSFNGLETWLYLTGEYGGGNWTVERLGGLDDRIDINDFRAIVGLEGIGQRGVTRFVELGYVFDRELISQAQVPARKLELQDTIMLRLGLEF